MERSSWNLVYTKYLYVKTTIKNRRRCNSFKFKIDDIDDIQLSLNIFIFALNCYLNDCILINKIK